MAFTGNASVVSSHPALRLLSSSTNQTAFVAAAQATPDGGGGTYAYVASDTSSGCLFTGSVSGTTLTVSSVINGALAVGLTVNRGDTGASIGTIVSGSGGTYTLSATASIPGPVTFTADNNSSFIVAVDGGRWFNVGYYQRTAAEIAAGVTPTNSTYPPGDPRRYGVDLTGATDCTTALNNALTVFADVFLPPGTYLISGNVNGGKINIPPNSSLTAAFGTVTINITANAGSTALGSSVFNLQNRAILSGLIINYPNQTLTDTVGAIIQYPPTWTINPSNNSNYGAQCIVKDILCHGAYILSSVQTLFADCLFDNITAGVLYRGFDFSGSANMQDTSRATNCQLEMVGSQWGFNAGPVNQWCQNNAIGVNAICTGGNRIDGFMMANTNVIGGSIGFAIRDSCWFQGVNISADSVVQAVSISGTASQFYADSAWFSLQQPNYQIRQIPAVQCSGDILRIVNAEILLQASGSQCGIFIEQGTIELGDIRFFTSLGGFAPAIYNAQGTVKVSGCTVCSGNSAPVTRPLTWKDVVVGTTGGVGNDTVAFSIDGTNAPMHWMGNLNPTNFGMSAWAGGVPTGWTTTAGAPGDVFVNLQTTTGEVGIQFGGTTTGAFTLTYPFTQPFDDLFGYYLFQCAIAILDPGAISGNGLSLGLTDHSGNNLYTVPISWPGSNTQPLAIPSGSYYPLSVLLCAPAGSSPGKFVITANFASTSNLIIRMKSLQIYGMATPPGVMGHEYWSSQSAGQPRDIQLGPNKRLLRSAIPVSGIWALQDVAVNIASPAAGTTEWRCTTAGTPGSWTGLTIP